MSKNAAITSFFKPIPKDSQSPRQSLQPSQLSPKPALPARASPSRRVTPPAPSSPLPLPSPSPAAPVRDRNAVIQGSEDEDDDDFSSDDDLPSFFTRPKGSGGAVPVPGRAGRDTSNLCATPKAKRTAVEFHSSPLTIMPKHKFDMRALMKHAEADNALEASERRMVSALSRESPSADKPGVGSEKVTTSLHETMLDVFPDADSSQDENTREKLMRAVKRTEATVHRKQYYFFKEGGDSQQAECASVGARRQFPKTAATGVWKFLAPAQGRAEFFEDGLPYHIQTKLQNLPDGIFLWILEEIPCEKSKKLREEYLRLLGACPGHAGRLMNEDSVTQIFRILDVSERALDFGPQRAISKSSEHREPYSQQRNWIPLQSVLRTIQETAHGMEVAPLIRSFSILLRLGMDHLVREDHALERDYQDAMLRLVESIPKDSWDLFCKEVGISLYNHVDEYSLRWDGVSSIPLLHPRLVELRRRLAIIFVFDDLQRGESPPEESFHMRAVLDRLESDDHGVFVVDRHRADYFELAALAGLLGIAIGDGNPPSPATSGSTSAPTAGSATTVRQYNADVDELAKKIKVMWSNIQAQGAAYASRMDARVMLKDLERRLQHATRTRPPPKDDIIFGIKSGEEYDGEERPKQQRFMKRFFQQGKEQQAPSLPALPNI
ncbi:hypothetical protein B0H66DRAFT_467720 [Apodospora peruviana]|uniref:Uncharacterized protein n=1 Tax=Apodospora peruviana TaxID=516989 RepID=A0AAE0MHB6_9PEZI|nr:hypothetical protein B0H66DRAFT_467720 [Apodospora peruviana]